jgi:hypothetical protein
VIRALRIGKSAKLKAQKVLSKFSRETGEEYETTETPERDSLISKKVMMHL